MLKDYLGHVVNGGDLTREQAQKAMEQIMTGQAGEAEIGAFLTALRMKGTSSIEIAGFVDVMRHHSVKIHCSKRNLLDTCGTGGDGKGTFNVSTTSAFVAAGAGMTVAKHGNRGLSSSCGSADVLTALGIRVDLPPHLVGQVIDEVGIGFMYAPLFHTSMKYVAKTRKELGFRTVFNILGPLTNPAKAKRQLIGVYEKELTVKVAMALTDLQVEHAMVVHSRDGLDEISTAALTDVVEVKQGIMRSYVVDPREYGFSLCNIKDYAGGTPDDNALSVKKVLQGEPGAKRDIVLLNAAAALVVGGRAADLAEGVTLATVSIDSGAAMQKLTMLKEMTQELYFREGLLSA